MQWLASIKDAGLQKFWIDFLDFPANCKVSQLSSSPDWPNASKRALAWLKLIETKIHQKVEEGWNFSAPIWENKDKLILLWSDASLNWIMGLIGWFIGVGGTYIEHEDVLQIRNESRLMALDLLLMVFLCAFSDSALTKKKKRIFLL